MLEIGGFPIPVLLLSTLIAEESVTEVFGMGLLVEDPATDVTVVGTVPTGPSGVTSMNVSTVVAPTADRDVV